MAYKVVVLLAWLNFLVSSAHIHHHHHHHHHHSHHSREKVQSHSQEVHSESSRKLSLLLNSVPQPGLEFPNRSPKLRAGANVDGSNQDRSVKFLIISRIVPAFMIIMVAAAVMRACTSRSPSKCLDEVLTPQKGFKLPLTMHTPQAEQFFTPRTGHTPRPCLESPRGQHVGGQSFPPSLPPPPVAVVASVIENPHTHKFNARVSIGIEVFKGPERDDEDLAMVDLHKFVRAFEVANQGQGCASMRRVEDSMTTSASTTTTSTTIASTTTSGSICTGMCTAAA